MLKRNYFYIAFSILFLVVFGFFICNTFVFTSVPVFSGNGAENGELVSLNLNARRAFVSGNETAFFRFSDVHKILLKNTFSEKGNVSVSIRLSARIPSSLLKDLKNEVTADYKENEEVLTVLGFLDKDDFNKNGKLDFSINNHPLVSADYFTLAGMGKDFMKGLSGFTYDVSFALPVDKAAGILNQKEGFFIKSNIPVKIKSVKISETVTGFDRSEVIPFYGFSSNGGVINFSSQSFDFTGSSNVFPVSYTSTNVPPELLIKMEQNVEQYGEKFNYSFSFGGERIRIKRLESVKLTTLSLKNAFSFVEASPEQGNVKAILMSNGDSSILNRNSAYSIIPVSVDPGLITSWPQKNWRCPEYELFKWDRFPNIIFFDTKNYAIQSKFFARIAFYIEKEGYKGLILSNEELKGKHDYNAHDYSAESLASFFNKTYISNFRLNVEEEILLEILLRNGILDKIDDPVKPYVSKGGAVLSISREIPSYNRVSLLAHEGWHTLFFTDSDFRNYVAAVYNVMDEKSMEFLMDYFKSQSSLGYDTNDEYLMQNEFMAYILQNLPNHAGEYFVKRAAWESVRKFTPYLCKYILETNGSGFDDCSKMLGEYVSDKYNLLPGNIGLVSY